MPTITQNLLLKDDPETIVHPNIEKNNIPAAAVTTDKIADGAITTGKIAPNAVTADKVANGAITTDKIASGAVTSGKIGDGEVGAGKLASGAVTTTKIAARAVTEGKLNIIDENLYQYAQRQGYSTVTVADLVTLFGDIAKSFAGQIIFAYINLTGYGTCPVWLYVKSTNLPAWRSPVDISTENVISDDSQVANWITTYGLAIHIVYID